MMSSTLPPPAKTRKVALQMALGAVAGGLGMYGLLSLLDADRAFLASGDRIFALGTALVYLLMGAMVGLGSLLPGVGAKTLNVEDADDVREQRTALLVGSATFLVVAILIGALALVRDSSGLGYLSASTATIVVAAAVLALTVLGVRYRKVGDELMRQVSREANGVLVLLLLAVVGGKAVGAVLGFTAPLAPLSFISAFFALYLAAIFIAAGRRGLLTPR
ncbi:hypothetical protein GCM10022281_02200 [Sphingomonas rosea]|uniref:Uncharacterized protein n=1 Tax=Sphingomonas rosea TaxID=335605 RepID=A0ABP7TJJ2_9SPHN